MSASDILVPDIWAIVPVKEIEGAKQRLLSFLTPDQRRTLAATMLRDVLRALVQVKELAGIAVVTLDPHAMELAKNLGVRIITEGARDGHTGAVTAAGRVLRREGRVGMLTVPGDIPRIQPEEVSPYWPPTSPAHLSPSSPRMTKKAPTRCC